MENDLIANRYKPLFPRARGGFSDVIVAWDTRLTRRVAIKRIHTGNNLPVTSLEEARTVALLSSPNIVNVYDFEQTGFDALTETLIIMENVDGPSLAELMSESTELLDIDVATTILDGIVAALEYAHENQVLHLDIKPANILIDQSGHIKVSDFGLAELAGSDGFGEVQGGTIGYMPPEQLTGGLVDARTDVWALAALSYQLLTGANPFFAMSPRESLQLINQGAVALPSELRPSLNGGIDEAIIKALSPGSEGRQASVAEFWLQIRPHLGKVAPGRRRLKTLATAWAGKEAATLETNSGAGGERAAEYTDDDAFELSETELFEYEDDSEEDEAISIWGGNYQGDTDDLWDERALARRQQRAQNRADRREERRNRGPKEPLWQRLAPSAQVFISRILCAFAAAGMAWLSLSALPYLSDPLAQAATAAAANTGNPTPALVDAAFTVRLALMLLVAIVAFIVPSVGSLLAAICLVLGFFFTGNWLVGFLVAVACGGWWVCIARRDPVDSALFPLSSFLAVASLPLLLPLLSGFFQNWRRALGTAAISCFVCSLLSLTTYGAIAAFMSSILGIGEVAVYGHFSSLPLADLLSVSPTLMQMPEANQLFIPFISLFTSAEFWIVLASWLGASVVMSLLTYGKSRVKYVIATLLSTAILAAGYLLPILFAASDNMVLLAGVLIRLAIALVLCFILIALGVQSKPYAHQK